MWRDDGIRGVTSKSLCWCGVRFAHPSQLGIISLSPWYEHAVEVERGCETVAQGSSGKAREAAKRWKAHPDKAREWSRRARRRRRVRALRLLSGRERHCACCGWNQIEGAEPTRVRSHQRRRYPVDQEESLRRCVNENSSRREGFRVLRRACNSIMNPGDATRVPHRRRLQYANHLHFHSRSVYRGTMSPSRNRVDNLQ